MVPLIRNLVPIVALRALGASPVYAGTAFLRESVRRTGIGDPIWAIVPGVQVQNTDVVAKKAKSLNEYEPCLCPRTGKPTLAPYHAMGHLDCEKALPARENVRELLTRVQEK